MLLFFSQGRLGNQLFQYAFLKTISKEYEKIVTIGFDELLDVFIIRDVVNVKKNNKLVIYFFYRVLYRFFNIMGKLRLISVMSVNEEVVFEKYKRELTSYNLKPGFFSQIRFVKTGFFQSEKMFNPAIIGDLQFRSTILNTATNIIDTIPNSSHTVFVHIRFGDYQAHKVFGRDVILPQSYYFNQIEWFIKNRKEPYFIFLSDEPEKVEQVFRNIKYSMISKNLPAGVDLAIMSLCKSGILSPSSFGWWGSYLMKNRDTVFVPKYWLGFMSKECNTVEPCPNFMTQIEI